MALTWKSTTTHRIHTLLFLADGRLQLELDFPRKTFPFQTKGVDIATVIVGPDFLTEEVKSEFEQCTTGRNVGYYLPKKGAKPVYITISTVIKGPVISIK